MGPEKMDVGGVMMLEEHFVIKSSLILEGSFFADLSGMVYHSSAI